MPIPGERFELRFNALGGVNTTDNPAEVPQFPALVQFPTCQNVYQPNHRRDLQTRPGMADVRATEISLAGTTAILTGMLHQGDFADRFLLSGSVAGQRHSLWLDNANPPTEITLGTNFAIGQDNLLSMVNFTDGTNLGTICCSRQRDTPQFVQTSGTTRSNLSISSTTLPRVVDVFDQRALYGAPSVSGTAQSKRVYWSDRRDGDLITDINTQFETFETEDGGDVLALKTFSDVCLVGLLNRVFLLAVTPLSLRPFAKRELPAGHYKGPVSHQGVVVADLRCWWMSQNNLVSMNEAGRLEEHADAIQPLLNGLSDSRRAYTIAGYDSARDLLLFAVSNGTDTQHNSVIAYNLRTEQFFFWSLSINAMAQRIVAGQNRLILGGYSGLFRNWASGTTGNLDNAASAIDADIISPRHHANAEDWYKLWEGVLVRFDQQGSESVTVQYGLNDASAWTSFAESPYSVRGTAGDVDAKFFALGQLGTHLRLRFRNATSGEVMRVRGYTLVGQYAFPWIVG